MERTLRAPLQVVQTNIYNVVEAIHTSNYNESIIMHQTASYLAVDVELRLFVALGTCGW